MVLIFHSGHSTDAIESQRADTRIRTEIRHSSDVKDVRILKRLEVKRTDGGNGFAAKHRICAARWASCRNHYFAAAHRIKNHIQGKTSHGDAAGAPAVCRNGEGPGTTCQR